MSYVQSQKERDAAYSEWLRSLKPGDKLCFDRRGSYYGGPYEILTVVRLTATQMVCHTDTHREVRVSRATGREIGNQSYKKARDVTDQVLEHMAMYTLKQWLTKVVEDKKGELTLKKLRAMRKAWEETND